MKPLQAKIPIFLILFSNIKQKTSNALNHFFWINMIIILEVQQKHICLFF